MVGDNAREKNNNDKKESYKDNPVGLLVCLFVCLRFLVFFFLVFFTSVLGTGPDNREEAGEDE